MVYQVMSLMVPVVLMLLLLWIEMGEAEADILATLENRGRSSGSRSMFKMMRRGLLIACGGMAGFIVYHWDLLVLLSFFGLGILALTVMFIIWAEREVVTEEPGTNSFARAFLLVVVSTVVLVAAAVLCSQW